MTRLTQLKAEHRVALIVALAGVIAAVVALFARGGIFAPRVGDDQKHDAPFDGRTTVITGSTNVAVDHSAVNVNTGTTTTIQDK